ncbi:MAG: NADH-quinone oxidoreductase subunit L, partial [Betaproteobacteria bacterium]
AITTLFMALVAIVQNDIKRVVAYSTLSQLGYMTVALGASAYSAAIFHLATHAFFKAVLFLGAGSVIIAMHHEQDMRRMGGLRRYMPITYATMLIAALASAGIPGLSGFFSKDAIIEATRHATVPGAGFAYFCVSACVFVTALYTFRLVFMTFHGTERFAAGPEHASGDAAHGGHGHDEHKHADAHGGAPHESPAVITLPLIALSIPAIAAGWLIGPVLFGSYFGDSIVIAPQHDGLATMGREFHGVFGMMAHAVFTAPFWLSIAGIIVAWFLYIKRPDLPAVIAARLPLIYRILDKKYGFDEFNEWFFARGTRALGRGLWRFGDVRVIDGFFVNGSARLVEWVAGVVRYFQSGYIYHYAFTMIIGVLLLVTLLFMQA